MNKDIMQNSTVSLLKQLGIKDADIKRHQQEFVHEVALGILEKSVELFKKKEYKKLKEKLAFSPSGDDMGCDSEHISFEACQLECECNIDLGNVLEFLMR